MKILILILLWGFTAEAQLVSVIVRSDTVFSYNPSTQAEVQLTKFIPSMVGQSGKVLSNNGTNYQWVVNSASVAWGGVTGTLSDQTDLQAALDAKPTQAAILLAAYPVGSVYISVVSTNPSSLFGGTWSAFGAGRVLVGIDAGQTEFDTVEETGGAKTHTLTTTEIPAHSHVQNRLPTATGAVVGFTVDTSMSGTPSATGTSTATTGDGGAHNNLQPYIVVYFFKRTS